MPSFFREPLFFLSALCVASTVGCTAPASAESTRSSSAALTTFSYAGQIEPFGGSTQTCLDVSGSSLQVGACTSGTTFTLVPVPNSAYVYIEVPSSDLCVDVKYGYMQSGSAPNYGPGTIDFVTCNKASLNQQWLVAGGQIVSANHYDPISQSDNNFCLDILDGSEAYDAHVDITVCNGTQAQEFWTAGPSVGFQSDYFTSTGTTNQPECLDIPYDDPAWGTQLDNYNCNNDSDAQWFVLTTNGNISPVDNTGLCLTANSNGNLELQTCFGVNTQVWSLVNKSVNGYASCSANGLCASTAETQQSTLVNASNGDCLDVHFGDSAPQTTIDHAGCTKSNTAQLWAPFLGNNQPQPYTPPHIP